MKWGQLRNLTAERPLAWAQLSHKKARLAVALTGVAFANILMFAQLGIRAVLFDGITLVHENLQGDLFLMSSYSRALGFQTFAQIYLYQANAVPGVATAYPLYIMGRVDWINPEQLPVEHPIPPELLSPPGQAKSDNKEIEIFPDRVKILAFNLAQPAFALPEINQQLDKLKEPDTILYDRLSQDGLGPIPALITQKPQLTTVMGNRRTQIAGLFTLGSTLFTKGHVIMSDLNYLARNGPESLDNVSLGLVGLDAGADPLQVQTQLQQALPSSIQVLTREELIQKEVAFYEADPSGIVLNFGAMMGFVVGVIVVYQVLYSDVLEHLPEYATLKAMGFADNALLRVVLQEALILAVLGFVPGCVASIGVYSLLSSLTKIPLSLRPDVMAQVFILTIVMCMGAGGIATQKLRQADPADVF
ncbi:FtsX-like permease family protein [Acaryochloris marina]|uniref:FtsX-like permease family protein n=1 Tax=Acaryochloris marina TaxID=155978 RepID=UPI001BAF58BE|nr:FtsX-like permease family protein [Acaryochloris marina]QUY42298.1 FtsX-like permease family protein [Acaryochloris marina S15]